MTVPEEKFPLESQAESGGCLGLITDMLMGFVRSCFDLNFYKKSISKSLISAILFFGVFALFISLFSTFSLWLNIAEIDASIEDSFVTGEWPEIVIEDGETTVNGADPFILIDEEGTLFAVDTTGEFEEIDRTIYYQGMLLTNTSIHILTDGEYQQYTLTEMQESFDQNPIIINQDTVSDLWQTVSSILILSAFIGIVLWNTLLRLMILTFLALFVWGVAVIFKRRTDYGKTLIVGIYALVPTTYLYFLFGLINFRVFLLHTILLLSIWIFVALKIFPNMTNTYNVNELDIIQKEPPDVQENTETSF